MSVAVVAALAMALAPLPAPTAFSYFSFNDASYADTGDPGGNGLGASTATGPAGPCPAAAAHAHFAQYNKQVMRNPPVGLPSQNDNWAVGLWLRHTQTAVSPRVVLHFGGGTSTTGLSLSLAPGAACKVEITGPTTYSSDYPIALGEWAHIGVTYNSPEFTVFINGNADHTETLSGLSMNPTRPIMFGDGPPGKIDYGAFDIDEVALLAGQTVTVQDLAAMAVCPFPTVPTQAPPTLAPPTPSPPTASPPTLVPSTTTPATVAPPTPAPATPSPPTPVPPTSAPTASPPTASPPTASPATAAPPTSAPATPHPPTPSPPSSAPPTSAPRTPSPPTLSPPTPLPLTPVPQTQSPSTLRPPTAVPATPAPPTAGPTTPGPPPPTATPATESPRTQSPATSVPLTLRRTAAPVVGMAATAAPLVSNQPTPAPAASALLATAAPEGVGAGTAAPSGGGWVLNTSVPRGPSPVGGLEVVRGVGGTASVISTVAGGGLVGHGLRGVFLAEECDPTILEYYAKNSRFVNPTQLAVIGNADVGMMVGNLAVILAVGTVYGAGVYLLQVAAHGALHGTQPTDCFVSGCLSAARLLCPGVALGGFHLVFAGDAVGLALIGCAALALATAAPLLVVRGLRRRVPRDAVYVTDPATHRSACECTWLIGPGEWVDTPLSHGLSRATQRFGSVLRPYRMPTVWYGAFDFVTMYAICCIQAVQVHARTLGQCGHVKVAKGVVMLCVVGVLGYTRPSVLARDTVVQGVVCFAQGVSMFVMAFGYYNARHLDAALGTAAAIMLACTPLLLVNAVVEVVAEVVVWRVGRRVRLERALQRAGATLGPPPARTPQPQRDPLSAESLPQVGHSRQTLLSESESGASGRVSADRLRLDATQDLLNQTATSAGGSGASACSTPQLRPERRGRRRWEVVESPSPMATPVDVTLSPACPPAWVGGRCTPRSALGNAHPAAARRRSSPAALSITPRRPSVIDVELPPVGSSTDRDRLLDSTAPIPGSAASEDLVFLSPPLAPAAPPGGWRRRVSRGCATPTGGAGGVGVSLVRGTRRGSCAATPLCAADTNDSTSRPRPRMDVFSIDD